MTNQVFLLTIPFDRWAPEHFVPDDAWEAMKLANHLTNGVTSTDELRLRRETPSFEVVGFDLTAELRWRTEPEAFVTSIRVDAIALDIDNRPLAHITVRATTRWERPVPIDDFGGAAQTFAMSLGCIDPIYLAARTISLALAMLDVDAEVAPSPTVTNNIKAVKSTSAQPPMSSEHASPLNPYALEGIPGDEADRWAKLGYSAVEAAPWKHEGFGPEQGAEWLSWDYDYTAVEASVWKVAGFTVDDGLDWAALGFKVDEACSWLEIGVDAELAKDFADAGRTPENVGDASFEGVSPQDFVAMLHVVPDDDMSDWIDLIRRQELLEPFDVETLVLAGLGLQDVEQSPSGLTAGEIVRFHTGELDGDHPDEYWDDEEPEDQWSSEDTGAQWDSDDPDDD